MRSDVMYKRPHRDDAIDDDRYALKKKYYVFKDNW